jgi:hypothetical protein
MKCEKCKEETHCIYITKDYEKLCGACCDREEQKKKQVMNA